MQSACFSASALLIFTSFAHAMPAAAPTEILGSQLYSYKEALIIAAQSDAQLNCSGAFADPTPPPPAVATPTPLPINDAVQTISDAISGTIETSAAGTTLVFLDGFDGDPILLKVVGITQADNVTLASLTAMKMDLIYKNVGTLANPIIQGVYVLEKTISCLHGAVPAPMPSHVKPK